MTAGRSESADRALHRLREPVPASRAMRANAKSKRAFAGRVFARFARQGPNSWDPFALRPVALESVDVGPGVRLQIEDEGGIFRMRFKGAVIVAEAVDGHGVPLERDVFIAEYVDGFAHAKGHGVSAHIAKTLSRRG
ncbi:MAG: hypothetical protein AAFX81_08800 [Pseudomonadota bacterium]